MTRPSSIVTVLLVSAFAFAACGEGSSPALSMSDYIQQADAICRQGHQELESFRVEFEGSGRTAAEKTGMMAEVLQGDLDSLQGLDPPPTQRSALESMLAMYATQIRNVEALGDVVESNDQVRIQQALSEGKLEQQRLSGLAHELGFQVCGQAG
jgi:hypothetical protein